jgi:DNA-binding beta-propeller fold protein YncE
MQAGRMIIERYNQALPRERFHARVDSYPPALRVWLLEAGIRHRADLPTAAEDGWCLDVERASSPAQGSVPGVHHVVSDRSSVWTCERAQRVARIDIETQAVVATSAVAHAASHLVHDAGTDRLFVADAGDNAMLALRASDLAVLQRWPAPGRPQLPVVSVDGIVCVTGSDGTLTIARPSRGRYVEQTIEVGSCPHDPVLTVDGAYAFVPCAGAAELVKVRLSDGAIAGRCGVGVGPTHLARDPGGTHIYSANSWDGTVSRVDLDGQNVLHAPSGMWAHAIDITPDGRWLWTANFYDDTVAVFDTATLTRVALLPTERYAHGLDISPDGRYVVATGFSSTHVRVYDAARHVELARIEVGEGSSHTAFSADAGRAFLGCSVSDHVACIDLEHSSLTARLKLH